MIGEKIYYPFCQRGDFFIVFSFLINVDTMTRKKEKKKKWFGPFYQDFNPWRVNVKGLSRKEAKEKRKREFWKWKFERQLNKDLKELYKEEISPIGKTYTKITGKVKPQEYPVKDGKSTYHRPLRNYWGNLYDRNTYNESFTKTSDHEDDHDGFYGNNQLWK